MESFPGLFFSWKKLYIYKHIFLVRPTISMWFRTSNWPYTVQTLDPILLCTRCIPQMHFWIESKIYPQLLPCLESYFTKQENLTPSLR
jgi:hypothetical protein